MLKIKNIKVRGFTVIELVVVIAIIGILSGIVMVNVTGYLARARDAKRAADINQIRNALEMYFVDKGVYPSASALSINADWINNSGTLATNLRPYLSKLPVDPTNSDIGGYSKGRTVVTGYEKGAHFYSYYLNPPPIVNGFVLCASFEIPKSSYDVNPLSSIPSLSVMGDIAHMYNEANGGVCIIEGK